MKTKDYRLIEAYMLSCMWDSAHDREHIYRVLYAALDIASFEEPVDSDVLIAACLLHDIGRREQFENPALCHAAVGAEKALAFLVQNGFPPTFAEKVASCIERHRFRSDRPPVTPEEKILFDADKLDVTGAIGLARTICYKGQAGEPLYSLTEEGEVSDGFNDTQPSFFQEYKRKLEGLYDRFYTRRGAELALQRRQAAVSFYENLRREMSEAYQMGGSLLAERLE